MVCNTCGRNTQNEEANFCEYCGSSFRENRIVADFAAAQNHATDQSIVQQTNQNMNREVLEKPISFLQWLGTYAILFLPMFIPVIGWVVPLVMLFVWAFANNQSVSKRNWSRATLIYIFVNLIIGIIYILTMLNSPIFQGFLKGALDVGNFKSIY
mgnify:CR=1 FL=1